MLLVPMTSSAQTFYTETFETDGNPARYTTSVPEFSDGGSDFFFRTDGATNISGTYDVTGKEGTFFFAAQDLDGEDGPSSVSLDIADINITGYTGLQFTIALAEDDASDGNEDWDGSDLFHIDYQIDGGGYQNLLHVESASTGFNGAPRVDTDFDGVGDGAEITDAFADFVASIAGTGASMDIRITINLESGDEDIAFDNIRISGTSTECVDTDPPVAVCKSLEVILGNDGTATVADADFDGGSTDDCTPAANLSFSASQTIFTCADVANSFTFLDDLIISEYVEGSSNNKYIELYNGTAEVIDLSDYELHLFSNGSMTPSTIGPLTGTMGFGATAVFANSSANIYTGPTTNSSAVNFNGDDAIHLYKVSTGTYIDGFGVAGEDPGSQWLVGNTETQNKTLRRKPTVLSGSIPTSGFPELPQQWNESSQDDVSDLGSHSINQSGLTVQLTVTDQSGKSSVCSAPVAIVDELPPVAICQDISVDLDASGTASITAAMINNGSSDNCTEAASLTLALDKYDFTCDDLEASLSDLIISEYVEGSSLNKYLEVYNGTGASVDLSDYELRLYSNGASSPSITNGLSGTLDDGAVIVYSNSGATAYGGATTNATAVNFNGDDAIGLYKVSAGMFVDLIGEIGVDPGAEWNVGGNETQDRTLRRNTGVAGGTIPAPGFPELETEWTEFSQNDVSDLGSFTSTLSGAQVTLTVTDGAGNSSTCTATVTVNDPLNACNPWSLIDGVADTQIDVMGDGYVIDLTNTAMFPTNKLTIEVLNVPAGVDKVFFNLKRDGTTVYNAGDRNGPVFSLRRDDGAGDYNFFEFESGNYSLTADLKDGNALVETRTLDFSVSSPNVSVTGFTLWDAFNDVAIGPLVDGQDVDVCAIGTNRLSIVAETTAGIVGKVQFDLSGAKTFSQGDKNAPYALNRDNGAGDYNAFNFNVDGAYTLTATPFETESGNGPMTGATVIFNIVSPTCRLEDEPVAMDAFPNPTTGKLNLSFPLYDAGSATIQIFDMNGRIVHQENTEFSAGEINHALKVHDLPAGVYSVSCRAGYEYFTARFVKQ
jgi:hypothetical protein